MGGGPSSSVSSTVEDVVNNTLQDINNRCANVCGNQKDNLNLIITDASDVVVDLSQTCSVIGTSCMARTYLETDITNNLTAVTTQTNSNDSNYLMFNFSKNRSSISETIRNNVSQMVNNFCLNKADNAVNNLYMYISNAKNVKVNGAQSGDVTNTQCSFDVTAKISLLNQESAKVDQTNKNVGPFADLITALVLLLGIGILFFFIFMMKGGKGGSGSSLCDQSNQEECQKAISSFSGGKIKAL
jgi:ATP-dependent Zn protease